MFMCLFAMGWISPFVTLVTHSHLFPCASDIPFFVKSFRLSAFFQRRVTAAERLRRFSLI